MRTGTGSIALNAPGDVLFTDPVVQGAVYTAGAAVTTPSDFTAPTLSSSYLAAPNGLVTTPAWGEGGGSVTVNAGQSIIGVGATQTPSGTATAETFADWYYRYGASDGDTTPFSAGGQTAAWVNYATFFQQFGALGGGNVSLKAGGDITNISASLPETLLLSGGITTSPLAHYYGGGDLSIQAGGNLNSGTFYVGRGSGLIDVSGAVQSSPQLTVQDGYISVIADGAISLGAVIDPGNTRSSGFFSGLTSGAVSGPAGTPFTTYGPQSGVSLTSLSDDVTFRGSASAASLLPPSLSMIAPLGDVTVSGAATLFPYPTDAVGHDTGALTLAAGGSISLPAGLTLGAPPTLVLGGTGSSIIAFYTNPLGLPSFSFAPANAATSGSVLLYAGQNIAGTLTVNRPAQIQAGEDIGAGATQSTSFRFIGENLTDNDVTSIIAGRDIGAITSGNFSSSMTIFGPGDLLVEAGRNINIGSPGGGGTGILAVGNGSTSGGFIPYLPAKSANITTLFGVGPGVDYASAIGEYIDPANAGTNGIDFLTDIAGILGQPRDQAWITFQGTVHDKATIARPARLPGLLDPGCNRLSRSSSPFFGQYARAYTAIDTLFPARLGYTANSTGGANGAVTTVNTGDLSMRFALIETQQQGDINIIGPGGGIRAGTAGRDALKPNQEGILTLGDGSIRIFTDQSVVVNQSRIMTQQGGDVDIFSANGDIDAGSGPKTFASNPVLSEICNNDGYCFVNPAGLVTGAGIGAVVTLPGQDPKKSNVTLVAPHGIVDAGAAGLRSANDLNIVALQVLNAYNIQAGGTTTGVPTVQAPPALALTNASNTTAATQQSALPGQSSSNGQTSVMIVEIIGYGGSQGSDDNTNTDDQRRRRDQ